MDPVQQIEAYLESQSEPKRRDMRALHDAILGQMPGCALSYLDGRDDQGKIVTNPNIGYGTQTLTYADGSTKEFYQIGLSGNTSGLSIFIMGLKDKSYLPETYGPTIGKATVTSYCIKFKKVSDLNLTVLMQAIGDGVQRTRSDRNR